MSATPKSRTPRGCVDWNIETIKKDNYNYVSHPSRVRGLKLYSDKYHQKLNLSHPSRVRGLKWNTRLQEVSGRWSHPSRVRGLKYIFDFAQGLVRHVAPLAGAWIEIEQHRKLLWWYNYVAPLAGAWIEIYSLWKSNIEKNVAPLAGAWIEIFCWQWGQRPSNLSHPSRVRGLKY